MLNTSNFGAAPADAPQRSVDRDNINFVPNTDLLNELGLLPTIEEQYRKSQWSALGSEPRRPCSTVGIETGRGQGRTANRYLHVRQMRVGCQYAIHLGFP
jgi:hypothetical protein